MVLNANIIYWRIAVLILLLSSMVSPFISLIYRGYVGLIPLLVISLFLVFSGKSGDYIINTNYKSYKLNRTMFLFLILFIVGVAFTFLRGANDYQYFISIILLPIYFSIGLFSSKNQLYKDFAIKSILVFILLNILFTGQSIGENESARQIYSDSDLSLTSGTSGFWALIGVFSPLFINLVIKQKTVFKKGIYALPLLFIVYKLSFSGFATPIALFLINLLTMGVLYLFNNKKNIVVFFKASFIFLALSILTFFLFNFFLNSNITAIEDVKWRFNNFIENPSGGGYDYGSGGISRFVLMEFSWNTFVDKMMFGGGGNIRATIYEGVIGGHSSAIDLLAVMGIFGGGGAFLFFMLKSLKNSYRLMKYKNNFNTICNFSVVISMIIGGIMNPYWSGPILMCYLLVVNIYKLDYNG
ncbi:hypothetical protein SAMN06265371_11113 [Lutibacter agarilyticus]|uniref:O-Antigen ligase n=1 Tax=Lutibacter agarilyticus TaxID=1109740 RepID=A0A238YVL6_9FLAO|nr:hypothetical protein [Lutibacter agarilyticus]SNR74684.1 hypothetical protein SAMN06265371_11113 [Lutibacter agarilyticus]